eukprot:gene1722-biopygen11076
MCAHQVVFVKTDLVCLRPSPSKAPPELSAGWGDAAAAWHLRVPHPAASSPLLLRACVSEATASLARAPICMHSWCFLKDLRNRPLFRSDS